MSDYTRIYNLTVKDSLPTGNSGKVIKGTELDAELNAVASAIASKADSNSPTFTGTPVAPTASAGTNTTQLATTAFVYAERTNTATLTNKTLTSPTINTPTISTPTITSPAISSATVTGSITMASDDTGIVKGTASVKVDGTASEVVIATSSGTTTLNSSGKLTNAGIVESTTGGFKFPDATTQTTAVTAYPGPGGQVFTSNGTFTIPTGITKVKVTITGGGGNGTRTGGGGAGGTAIKWLTSMTPGNTLAVTVGGQGATSSVASGTQTITTVSATGGASPSGYYGGEGGIGSGGDLNLKGGGGQGLSGVTNDSGIRAGGVGGSSYWGGAGVGGDSTVTASQQNGGNYGGGGAGGPTSAFGGEAGGTGAAGVVVFEW